MKGSQDRDTLGKGFMSEVHVRGGNDSFILTSKRINKKVLDIR